MTNERSFSQARPEGNLAGGPACPGPQMLAEYLDGKLDATARGRLEDHMSRCEDCYFVVKETMAMNEPLVKARRAWSLGGYMLPVAAALLVGLGSAALWRQARPADPYAEALRPLVDAVGPRRLIEPRLTGSFKDGPLVEQKRRGPSSENPPAGDFRRGASIGDGQDWAVLGAAAEIQARAQKSPSFENERALAAASLLVGDVEGAIALLSRLRRTAPENAGLLSDLAAAYLEAGPRQPERYPLALEAASQALSRSPSLVEAMSNKALAAEALGLRKEARSLWEQISRKAPTAEWRAEAARRAADLSSDRRDTDRPSYEKLDGVLADESLPDHQWLARVREISSHLAQAFGDTELGTLATVPAGLEISNWRSLHLLYGRGRRHYSRFEFDDAATLLTEFSQRAKGTRSPLLPWAEAWSTIANRFKEPSASIKKLRAIVQKPYPAVLLIRCYTAMGVVETEQGRYQEALADYDRAKALSVRSNDLRSQLALGAMTSSLFDRLGRRSLAWSAAIVTLRQSDEIEPRLAPNFFQRLAEMSVSQDMPRTAAMFAEHARQIGTLPDAPSLEWTLARVAGALGDLPGAQAHLLRAAELSAAHPDKSGSEKMMAETTLVSLELAARGIEVSMDPSLALRYFAAGSGDGREWLARVAEGLAQERHGQADAALASFEKATELLESRSASLAGGWSLANRNLQVPFGRAIEAAFDEGDHWGALAKIENLNRLRRGAMREKIDGPALAAAVGRWDEPTAVLVLWPGDRRVLRWWVRPGAVTADSIAVSRLHLEGLVDQYAIGDEAMRRDAAIRMRELIGRPPSTGPWLVMPLGPFRAVPFIALPEGAGVLGERLAIGVIPTLIPVARRPSRRSHAALEVMAPGYPQSLPGAAQEARRLHLSAPESLLFDGRAATREIAIKALSQARVVHFAGHISYSADNPERSAIWVTDPDGRELPLTLGDLRAVDLDGMDLLFLSACSSVRTSPELGYASTSLAEQFLDQGAAAVVGSLWDVPDGLAAEIVQDFYVGYLRDGNALEALVSAQRRALARKQPSAGWASYQILQLKHIAAS